MTGAPLDIIVNHITEKCLIDLECNQKLPDPAAKLLE